MRSIIVKIKYAVWAYQRIKFPHIGDVVEYKGKLCSLIQGRNNPYWDLLPLDDENLQKQQRKIHKNIHVRDFKVDGSLSRKLWAFKSSYRFRMSNWYQIDKRKALFSPITII